jgi:hypothetical protein
VSKQREMKIIKGSKKDPHTQHNKYNEILFKNLLEMKKYYVMKWATASSTQFGDCPYATFVKFIAGDLSYYYYYCYYFYLKIRIVSTNFFSTGEKNNNKKNKTMSYDYTVNNMKLVAFAISFIFISAVEVFFWAEFIKQIFNVSISCDPFSVRFLMTAFAPRFITS